MVLSSFVVISTGKDRDREKQTLTGAYVCASECCVRSYVCVLVARVRVTYVCVYVRECVRVASSSCNLQCVDVCVCVCGLLDVFARVFYIARNEDASQRRKAFNSRSPVTGS